MKKMILFAMLLAFALLVWPVQGNSQPVVNGGITTTMSEVPLYLAMEKGWLKEAGVEVKLHRFTASGFMLAPLSTGQLQLFTSGIGVGTYNAVARGLPLALVAGTAYNMPAHDTQVLMLRTDLKEKMKKIGDLKGGKFATNALSSSFNYALGKTIEPAGLTLKDVKMVVISVPDMVVAFRTKAIDFAYMFEPMGTLAEAQGVAIKWKKQSETVSPYHQTAGIFFNRDWARNNPEQATGFMLAWLKGTRAFYEAYKYGTNRKEIVDVAMKYLPIKDPGLYEKMEWPYTNPNGYLDLKSIEDQINWYYAQGQATHRLEVSQVVDHTYVEQAIKKLGEYKPR